MATSTPKHVEDGAADEAVVNAGPPIADRDVIDAEIIDDDEPIVATIDETGEVQGAALVAQEPIVVDEPMAPATPQVVYVTVPHPPKKKSNRLIGTLIAFAASLVYAAVLALVFAIVWASLTGGADLGFVGSPNFYIPVALFAVALILVVLVVNRAGWWAYVLGSIVVALIVYFGLAGALLLINDVVRETPETAAELYRSLLLNPLVIISALVAREVAVWAGVLISVRGRKVKARNLEARAAYDRERAEEAAARQ
jgi:hypothetical protein